VHLATLALGAIVTGGPTHGLVTVCRDARPFAADDLELLRSLAARASLALSDVNLHFDMQRQAITDDLTGLASHGRFQELLDSEMQAVRRYRYPVGLIMLDIDDFKAVNDRYGHQQGDVVLRYVAEALLEISRDVDIAARYGGEEMALILPYTDLEGTYDVPERVRMTIEGWRCPTSTGRERFRSGPAWAPSPRRMATRTTSSRPRTALSTPPNATARIEPSRRCQKPLTCSEASSLFTHGSS
jgi:diguanylate cyclase (GGDEF)-like protein